MKNRVAILLLGSVILSAKARQSPPVFGISNHAVLSFRGGGIGEWTAKAKAAATSASYRLTSATKQSTADTKNAAKKAASEGEAAAAKASAHTESAAKKAAADATYAAKKGAAQADSNPKKAAKEAAASVEAAAKKAAAETTKKSKEAAADVKNTAKKAWSQTEAAATKAGAEMKEGSKKVASGVKYAVEGTASETKRAGSRAKDTTKKVSSDAIDEARKRTREREAQGEALARRGAPQVDNAMKSSIDRFSSTVDKVSSTKFGARSESAVSAVSKEAVHFTRTKDLMSPATAVANILADLCPHGMLPLAFGIAADEGTGTILASATLIIFGFLSWYSHMCFARAAEATLDHHDEGESISAVWAKTVSGGEKTMWIPDAGCALLTIGCCLFYSAFIGDLFGSLAQGFLPDSLPGNLKKRFAVLLTLHTIPILPLCLLRDLSALKYSSMVGLAGIVYTLGFVGMRMFDGSYSSGGQFFASMSENLQAAAQKAFPGKEGTPGSYLFHVPPFFAGKGLFTLMNMCCVAFACHYNSVKYYMELKNRTLDSFGKVMATGIGGTAIVFLGMMLLGYGTFGANSQAVLLNNYHNSKDVLAAIAKVFTGLAIVSGYPLMFAGLKSAVFSLTKLDRKSVVKKDEKQNALSLAMLVAISTGACFVTEHELATVIGIVGSIFGSFVIYILPAIVSNSLLSRNVTVKPFFKGERTFNKMLIGFGVMFAVLGTWVTVSESSGAEHK